MVSFFSGTVISFKILPFGLDRWIHYQSFGSMGGAFLSLYVGSAQASEVISVQLFWNIVILLSVMLQPTGGIISVLGMSPEKDRIALMKKLGVLFGNRTELWWDHPWTNTI